MQRRFLVLVGSLLLGLSCAHAQNQAPTISQQLPDRTVYTTGRIVIDLMEFFRDPDANFDVRLGTVLGDIDLDLFEAQTPQTVANFLRYVDEGRYFRFDPVINALSPSFIHRLVEPNFVIQGGGFLAMRQSASNPNRVTATAVDALPPIPNEPGISNTRGTIAMAKLAGNPNSATSQWFINLSDNGGTPPNGLDYQNGGFTAFGRVVNNGMSVADAIAQLPTYNFGGAFTELPLRNPPQNNNVRIGDLVLLPRITRALSFSTDSVNDAVVEARISGTKLILRGLQAGSTPVHVSAHDLGGAQITQTFITNVQVGPPRLVNISTRAEVGTGDNVLIGGFILGGSTGSRRIIVRGLGPTLAQFGLQGVLADPFLELRDSTGALVASNDNWTFSHDEQAIIDANLAPSNSNEAAIIATLPVTSAAGVAYTTILRGVNNGTGNGLVEIYDLDGSPGPRLLNLSTRGFVDVGDDVLIGGMIISGNAPQKVVLRALGPSLANAGVPGTLPDPSLELRNGQGVLLESNDDWQQSPDAAEVSSYGVSPQNQKEAAFIHALAPGGYTAIVRGAGDLPSGVGIIEIYAVD